MNLIDTHTHLQFKAFEGKVAEIIQSAKNVGIEKMIVVGTNIETSRKAIALAEKFDELYAAIGIHPHHVFPFLGTLGALEAISELESLIKHPKVTAIGETGLDRHIYEKTHYKNYKITEEFIDLQKVFFKAQINLAIKHQKSLIIHNREAVSELLEILEANWDPFLGQRSVFHCSEPDQKILDFALKHQVFIGIDGDITYNRKKQEFFKKVPLDSLVLETDSPYFLPEPLKSKNTAPNEPKNLRIIAEHIAWLKQTSLDHILSTTTANALQLFSF